MLRLQYPSVRSRCRVSLAVPENVSDGGEGLEPIGQDVGVVLDPVLHDLRARPWPDGTKTTGKAFSFKGLTLMRLKDGKIVSQFDSYDALGIKKQLGLN
jgi:hypothetical protein